MRNILPFIVPDEILHSGLKQMMLVTGLWRWSTI